MPEINDDITAYDKLKAELEDKFMSKWVLFYDGKLVQTFDEFEDAAAEAVKRFGRGPYLIRQVGAPPVTLPASVVFFPLAHARG